MKRLLVGAAAGAAATVPMTMAMEKLHEWLPGEPRRPLPSPGAAGVLTEHGVAGTGSDEPEMQPLTLGAHVGYGAACGAVFGLIAPSRPAAAIAAGMLFGLGVWAGSQKGWLPPLDVRHDEQQEPPLRTSLLIAAHLVWGAAMALEITSGREQHA